jgi:hypothetical protein
MGSGDHPPTPKPPKPIVLAAQGVGKGKRQHNVFVNVEGVLIYS